MLRSSCILVGRRCSILRCTRIDKFLVEETFASLQLRERAEEVGQRPLSILDRQA